MRSIVILFIVFILFCNATDKSEGNIYNDYVLCEEGSIPVLISAPHGGRDDIPIAVRTTGNTNMDLNTLELAKYIYDKIVELSGKKPYMVAALFHRKYVDANRDKGSAYSDDRGEGYYDAYHNKIIEFVKDIRDNFGSGILIDLHGQSTAPAIIYRGTRDGLCITNLVKEYGSDILYRSNSILGYLKQMGYNIYPESSDGLEEASYNGGYIVWAYGSHNTNGIEALQLEIGSDYRGSSNLSQTADDIAYSIWVFCSNYLMK